MMGVVQRNVSEPWSEQAVPTVGQNKKRIIFFEAKQQIKKIFLIYFINKIRKNVFPIFGGTFLEIKFAEKIVSKGFYVNFIILFLLFGVGLG